MMKNQYTLKIVSYRMLQNYSTVHYLTCVSEKKLILNPIIRSTLKIKKTILHERGGAGICPCWFNKYFKICEEYELKPHGYQQTHIIRLVQNLQFLAQLCPKYHLKPEDSHQNFEYILCKNCNNSSTGRHAKLSKRKFDFNIFDIDVIIVH